MESYPLKEWFKRVVALPVLPRDSYGSPQLERGLAQEALSSLMKRQQLAVHRRVETLNQTYWMGLVALLKKLFPFVSKIVGSEVFYSQLALPFLSLHPPQLWSSKEISEGFPRWIALEFNGELAPLVRAAAMIDSAYDKTLRFSYSFKYEDTLSQENGIVLLANRVAIFELESDLFSLRNKMLNNSFKEVDLSLLMSKERREGRQLYFLLSCDHGEFSVEKIHADQYHVLKAFEKGATLLEAFEGLKRGDRERALVSDQWQEWLSTWSQHGFLRFQ